MASETKTSADTILIVDHDDEQRGLLVDGLGQDGFIVEVVKDGISALKAARAQRPAAVIVGKLVSDMRGEYVVRELKTNRHTAPIPVIMMCGAPRGGPRRARAEESVARGGQSRRTGPGVEARLQPCSRGSPSRASMRCRRISAATVSSGRHSHSARLMSSGSDRFMLACTWTRTCRR